MEKVNGIGGFFFRAKDTGALMKWYEDNLGINPVPSDYGQMPWMQEVGPTVWVPFAEDTDYFGRDDKQWMVNFRVSDLGKMVEQLRSADIEVEVDPEMYPNGTFARLNDPEGNPIQLWEPKGKEA